MQAFERLTYAFLSGFAVLRNSFGDAGGRDVKRDRKRAHLSHDLHFAGKDRGARRVLRAFGRDRREHMDGAHLAVGHDFFGVQVGRVHVGAEVVKISHC